MRFNGRPKIMAPMTRWTPPQANSCHPSLPLFNLKLGSLITSGAKRRSRRRALVSINTHYYIHLVRHLEGSDHQVALTTLAYCRTDRTHQRDSIVGCIT
jgi:hypothetical protein